MARTTNISSVIWTAVILILCSSCDKFQKEESGSTSKKTFREFSFNERGDTVITYYHTNGNLKSQMTIKRKRKNGPAFNFYENGEIQNEIQYFDGYKNGSAKWFYESGKLYRETFYQMGLKNGIQKKYYENGSLKAEIPYEIGEPVVGTKEYTKTGKLITDYTKIDVSLIDKLASESKYYLRLKLKPEKKKVQYYFVVDNGSNKGKIILDEYTKDGVAYYPVAVPPGRAVKEKMNIRAVIKTRHGNPMVLSRTYHLAVENRKSK